MQMALIQQRLHEILDEGALAGPAGALLQRAMLALTLLSSVGVVLLADGGAGPSIAAAAKTLEWAALAAYSAEHALRLWCAPADLRHRSRTPWGARLRFAASARGLLDLLVIAAILAHLLGAGDPHVAAALSLLRLQRVARYSPALTGLFSALAESGPALTVACAIVGVVACIAGAIVHFAERVEQPEAFGRLAASIWWSVSTMAATDAVDAAPNSLVGQAVMTALGLFGYMIVALPMGIVASIFARKTEGREFVVTWSMLAKAPFFRDVEPTLMGAIVERLGAQKAPAGAAIVRKGDLGDQMYFILAGEAVVETPQGPVTLHAGDYFGEQGLLERRPRSATIRAVTALRLLTLARPDLEAILDHQPEAALRLRQAIAARSAEPAAV